MKTDFFCRSAALCGVLLLLTGCGARQNEASGIMQHTDSTDKIAAVTDWAAETSAASVTASPASDENTAEDPSIMAFRTMTAFLDACISHDNSALWEYSNFSAASDVCIGRYRHAVPAVQYYTGLLMNAAVTSYSIDSVHDDKYAIQGYFAGKARAFREEAQRFREDGFKTPGDPVALEQAADQLDAVTCGFTFEITAEPGIHMKIPVVQVKGGWRVDIWVLGDMADLVPGYDDNGDKPDLL